MTTELKSSDRLILRTPEGETAFTATEYDLAMHFAKRAAFRGRSVLIAHIHRPRAKHKISPIVLWSDSIQREIDRKADEARKSEAAKKVPTVRKVPGTKPRKPRKVADAVA